MYRAWDWHITSDHPIPGHWAQGHCVRDTGDTTGATFLCPLTVRVRSWTMNRSNKCRPDTHIVFIWMFVGEIHLSEAVAGESRLIMRGRGQASNNVTFISQPPSNQMSLLPTYLITVLIYGIISYQTQNLPQLKLWGRASHLLYEWSVFWVTFCFLPPPRPSNNLTCQSHHKLPAKTNSQLWFINFNE